MNGITVNTVPGPWDAPIKAKERFWRTGNVTPPNMMNWYPEVKLNLMMSIANCNVYDLYRNIEETAYCMEYLDVHGYGDLMLETKLKWLLFMLNKAMTWPKTKIRYCLALMFASDKFEKMLMNHRAQEISSGWQVPYDGVIVNQPPTYGQACAVLGYAQPPVYDTVHPEVDLSPNEIYEDMSQGKPNEVRQSPGPAQKQMIRALPNRESDRSDNRPHNDPRDWPDEYIAGWIDYVSAVFKAGNKNGEPWVKDLVEKAQLVANYTYSCTRFEDGKLGYKILVEMCCSHPWSAVTLFDAMVCINPSGMMNLAETC